MKVKLELITGLLIISAVTGGLLAWSIVGRPNPTIEEVIERNRDWLMSLDGVVDIGIGEVDGAPCIKVYVEEGTSYLKQVLSREINGFGVMIEEVGEVITHENRASIMENGIRLTIEFEKTEFNLGEDMVASLSVTNERDENFSFDTVAAFDFILYDENFQTIYWWSIDKAFIMVVIEATLKPGESYSENLSWDLNLYDPDTGGYLPIVPGRYYIRGAFRRDNMVTPSLLIMIS